MASVYQLRFGAVSAGKNFWECVMHYRLTEAGSGTPVSYADRLIAAWLAQCQASLLACLSSDTVVNLIDAKKITAPGGPSISETISQTGNEGTNSQSAVVASDIAFYPGGAKNRPGHIFLGGVGLDAIVMDVISNPYLAALNAFAANMMTTLVLGAGLGDAALTTYTKKTHVDTLVTDFRVKPKATGMNKRTLPFT